MSHEFAVSVIVPVHNQSQFLARTLQSLREQTVDIRTIQFLLIDDGSTDDTATILENFRQEVPHAQITHETFNGVAKARNFALELVRAPYIAFIDGDDVVAPDAVAQWLNATQQHQADIVLTPLHRSYNDSLPRRSRPITAAMKTPDELWLMLLKHREYMGHLIGGMFASHLFSSLRFPHLTCYSDIYIVPDLLAQNPKVCWLDCPLYCYRQHAANISANLSDKKAKCMLTVFEHLDQHIANDEQRLLFQSFYVRQGRVILDNTRGLSDETKATLKRWVDQIPLWSFLLSPHVSLHRKRLLVQTKSELR